MRYLTGFLLALALAGCAGVSSGGSAASEIANAPDGCIAYGNAGAAWQEFQQGLQDKTITDSDGEALLKKIGSNMDDAALISKGAMQTHAQAAATEAKQLRVALIDGSSNVVSLAGQLDSDLSAVDAACSAGK